MNSILFALWFFLPAGIANAVPVVAKKIPLLEKFSMPLDFGKTFRGKRIFGDNKTWRGLLFGIAMATLIFGLQKLAFNHLGWVQDVASDVNYYTLSWWLGPLLGAGALIGDAIESFAKRQFGVAEGNSWFPFDQLDYIIGGLLASSLVITLPPAQNVAILIVWFIMHLIWSYIGYALKLKKQPI